MGLPCRYSSDKAGQYELAVKSNLHGEPLAGSPFSLTVAPGELSPAHCTALLAHSGDCLTAGSQALLRIQAKDRFGNNVKSLPSKPFLLCQTCLVLCSFSYSGSVAARLADFCGFLIELVPTQHALLQCHMNMHCWLRRTDVLLLLNLHAQHCTL